MATEFSAPRPVDPAVAASRPIPSNLGAVRFSAALLARADVKQSPGQPMRRYHHTGIPTDIEREGEIYLPEMGIHVVSGTNYDGG